MTEEIVDSFALAEEIAASGRSILFEMQRKGQNETLPNPEDPNNPIPARAYPLSSVSLIERVMLYIIANAIALKQREHGKVTRYANKIAPLEDEDKLSAYPMLSGFRGMDERS